MYRRDARGRVVKSNDHVMDSCVVAETPVITRDGVRPIVDLVGRQGWVLTRGGAWAWSLGARRTRLAVPVVRVVFEDGHAVVCTPDHPFLTATGWRRADQMAGVACENAVAQREEVERWRFACRRRFRSFKAFAITCAGRITSAMASVCTAPSGSPRMVPSLAGSMSTTETTIVPITDSKILNSSGIHGTPPTISADTGAGFRPQRWQQPRRGTGLMRGVRCSDASIARVGAPVSASESPARADIAAPRLWDPSGPSSAPTAVRAGRVWRLVWTTWNGLAWSAAACLWRIGTCRDGHARARARLRCLTVTPAGSADVYCLTVPGPSAFCLANGAVVHNTRYLARSGIVRMKRKPPKTPQTNVIQFERGSTNLNWMGN